MTDLSELDAHVERLADFLRQRIDEDELAVDVWDDDPDTFDKDNPPAGWFWPADRIRAECAAKRGIVHICSMPEGQFGALIWLAQPYANHPDFDPLWLMPEE